MEEDALMHTIEPNFLSVPQDWGTPSCYNKTRVVIHNYALRSWAAGPLGSGSISPD